MEVRREDQDGLAVLLGHEVDVDAVQAAPPRVPEHGVVPDGAPLPSARLSPGRVRTLRPCTKLHFAFYGTLFQLWSAVSPFSPFLFHFRPSLSLPTHARLGA